MLKITSQRRKVFVGKDYCFSGDLPVRNRVLVDADAHGIGAGLQARRLAEKRGALAQSRFP